MLTCLEQARSPTVQYEVAVSMRRLVDKFGQNLQLMTWDVIVRILGRLFEQIGERTSTLTMVEVREIISTHTLIHTNTAQSICYGQC